MARKDGDLFQKSIEDSCKKLSIFCDRIKDSFVPHNARMLLSQNKIMLPTSKNKYDFYIFKQKLFPLELKSSKTKSFSFNESIIKQHQIDALVHAGAFENVIAGFLFNFREPEDRVFFVHIDDFIKYKDIAENQKEHTYKSKINRSSVPLAICEEIGIEIESRLKKVKYHYHMNKFIEEAIRRYGGVLKNHF